MVPARAEDTDPSRGGVRERFQVDRDGLCDTVRLGERPDPEPGPGQVRLRMAASARNGGDLLVPRKGSGSRLQDLPLTVPLVLLRDGVGVTGVHEGADGLAGGRKNPPQG